MQTPILLHKNYTLNEEGYQLKLPLNLETIIPVDDSVRLLSQFVEAMDLTDLYSTYERINTVSPRTLLKIVLYSYMNGDYSSRSMELNCKRDINFMYLLEGKPVPDHATFARFRSIHFAPCAKRILAEMSGLLYELGEISGETIFIDGTKIEACANKYTFVWKKSVSKNQEKLLMKIADFIDECEQLYGIQIVHGDTVKMKHVKRLRRKLYALKQEENIDFVHDIGKRKSPLQKSIETLESYLDRLKGYTKQIQQTVIQTLNLIFISILLLRIYMIHFFKQTHHLFILDPGTVRKIYESVVCIISFECRNRYLYDQRFILFGRIDGMQFI